MTPALLRVECGLSHPICGVPVDLHLYAGQDHFFDQEPQFCDAIADAMALFIARYVPVRLPVTTA